MSLVHVGDRADAGEIHAPGDWLGKGHWRVATWGDARGGRFGIGFLEADPLLLMRIASIRQPLVVWGEHAQLTIRVREIDLDGARFDVLATNPPKKPRRRALARSEW